MIDPQTIIQIAFITFGFIIGSFLNVCISRMPKEKSVVFPPSACMTCQKNIPWYCNIPILSYLFLRGRCLYCKSRIPFRYLLVECITPALFLLCLPYPYILWPFYVYFLSSLVIATFIDLEHWIIPDKITLPGIPIGILSSLVHPYPFILDSVLGMIFGGGSLLVIGMIYEKMKKTEGIGGGDIKFLAMGGAFLGFKGIILTLLIASITGMIIGLITMIKTGKGGKTAIPFGPFLSAGMLITFIWGTQIWDWYLALTNPQSLFQ